jgi:hypothetical protein
MLYFFFTIQREHLMVLALYVWLSVRLIHLTLLDSTVTQEQVPFLEPFIIII